MPVNHNSAAPRFNHISLDDASYLVMASFFKLPRIALVRRVLSVRFWESCTSALGRQAHVSAHTGPAGNRSIPDVSESLRDVYCRPI